MDKQKVQLRADHTPDQRAELVLTVLNIQGSFPALKAQHAQLTQFFATYQSLDRNQEREAQGEQEEQKDE